MGHFLTEDQAAFRDAAEAFARKEIEPIANQIDQTESTPPELYRKVAEQGFFGLYIPEEYGGVGGDFVSTCLVLEELAKASPALAGVLAVEMILCPRIILHAGSEEQKRRILPRSASGERVMALSQTEPAGALNTAFHQTRLTPDGNNWRLNGAKLFCTQGEGKTYLVFCRTEQNGEQGYGCVIVEQEQDGFHVAPYEQKLGWRGTNTGGISFDDVLITPDNIVGNLLTANMEAIIPGASQPNTVAHAVTSLGCTVGLFDKTLAYVKDRNLYGEPMSRLSPVSDRLASIWTRIEAMRALCYTAARYVDAGQPGHYGSICKSWVCDTAFECCSTLLQMWGGSGMMDSTGVNRYFRDARAKMVAEASTEMHHDMIAKELLGLA
ncbi:MAG: acyl-CoA dehydrogenase family protein [Sphingobium sp.]